MNNGEEVKVLDFLYKDSEVARRKKQKIFTIICCTEISFFGR